MLTRKVSPEAAPTSCRLLPFDAMTWRTRN